MTVLYISRAADDRFDVYTERGTLLGRYSADELKAL